MPPWFVMCIPFKNNLCKTTPDARCLYTLPKNKCIVGRKKLNSKKKLRVILLIERIISLLLSVTHTLLAVDWAGNKNFFFALERDQVFYMGKEKLILRTFWRKYSLVAQLCQLRHQRFVSPSISSRPDFVCVAAPLAAYTLTFLLSPLFHMKMQLFCDREQAITAVQCCCGVEKRLLNGGSLVTQRVCLVLHSPIAVMLLKALDCRLRGCPVHSQ